MKTELTVEQSQHLFDLGVSKEKASGMMSEGNGYWATTNYYPVFKLEDFLNGEILPKEMGTKDTHLYLEIQMLNNICCVSYEYTGYRGCKVFYESEELIDALYQLTCWYYGEYLKAKKNETLDCKGQRRDATFV